MRSKLLLLPLAGMLLGAPRTLAAQSGGDLKQVTAEEGFHFRMPGEPQVQRNKVTISAGDVTTAAWTLQSDEGVIYSIATADYPQKLVDARPDTVLLLEGRDGLTNQLKGTVKEERKIDLQGHPGRAFTVASDAGEVRARSYLVGNRLYTLLVLYNPSIGAPHADAFLGSLELTSPPARK
jgi:hypothetical protein